MWLGVKKNSFWFYSILLLILAYPFNIRVLKLFNPADIIFISVFAAAFLWGVLKKSKIDPLVLVFLLFILASSFFGIVYFGFNASYMVFLYKYLLMFLLAWFVLSAELRKDQVILLLKVLLFSFCFLVFYVYFYQYRVFSGAKLIPRPDFPFSSTEALSSGAHLYGAYLSTGLMACTSYWLFISRRSIFWMALMFLSFGAILLTGSRAPIIAILFGYAALFFIAAFGKGMFSAKKKVLLLIFIVGISAAVLLPILAGKLEMFEKAMSIIERATNFSGISSGSDGSVLGRAQKIETGTAAVLDNSVIFGTGISSTPFVWVDNSFVRLLIDSGFGGLMLFAFIILGFVFNVFRTARANGNIRLFYVFFLACLTYFVNSVSTEFFLVTRSIFPFIILVCLIYKLISMPDLSKERAGP